ncbi:MAG: S1C family serine protease [Synergistales bacterium]|nr:S1C family serine protease [Synergistales bacterium]
MGGTVWSHAIEQLYPFACKIRISRGTGTGCILSYDKERQLCCIATANHVISHAEGWNEPIRIIHAESGVEQLISPEGRTVYRHPESDLAVIFFSHDRHPQSVEMPSLTVEDEPLHVGNEVGWAGFPSILPDHFSFFSGRVSTALPQSESYLMNGEAMSGVSGGPAFIVTTQGNLHVVGIVTAYIPERAPGEYLPGVCTVAGITSFYKEASRDFGLSSGGD